MKKYNEIVLSAVMGLGLAYTSFRLKKPGEGVSAIS